MKQRTLLALLIAAVVLLVCATHAGDVAAPYKRSDYVLASQFRKARALVLKVHARPNGTWYCAYTKRVVKLDDSLDIDHIVPVKYAHAHGLSGLTLVEKRVFGVDTLNMVQVLASVNRSKGDDGPSEFMPKENRCFYAKRWRDVSAKYLIRVDPADSAALARQLRYCR